MNEFKPYAHGFLGLTLVGLALTMIWILWPVLVAVLIALVLAGLVWAASQFLKH